MRGGLIGIREPLHVGFNGTLISQELNIGTVDLDASFLAELDVFVAAERGEAPVLADDDLLATGELVHGSTEGFDGGGAVGVTGADGQEDLADVDTGDDTVGLTESSTHTGLQSIGTGT